MIVSGEDLEIRLEDIPIDLIQPDLEQPRRYELELELQAKGLDSSSAKRPDGIEMATRFDELRRSIVENQGVSMPLVVEKANGTFRLVDGDRRLGAVRSILSDSRLLEEDPSLREKLDKLPCLVVDGPLTKSQRLTLLSHIHLHLAEWRPIAKQKVAMELQEALQNEQTVSAVMASKPTSIKRDREIHEVAERLKDVKGARAVSYARELMSIKQSLRTPDVKDLTLDKIRRGVINDAVDIRRLREILPDPDARAVYLQPNKTIKDAMNIVEAKRIRESLGQPTLEFKETAQRLIAALKTVRFEDIVKYKGDRELRNTIDEAISLLSTFKGYI